MLLDSLGNEDEGMKRRKKRSKHCFLVHFEHERRRAMEGRRGEEEGGGGGE